MFRAASFFRAVAVAGMFIGAASSAKAGITTTNFASTDSLESTGVTFEGSVEYDSDLQKLMISLSNNSSFQSVITGFYLNIAGTATATYSGTDDGTTAGVDESAFASDTSLSPFGTFDMGLALTDLSMQQVKGIDEGQTGIFEFSLSGADAGTLTSIDFLTDTNSGGGISGAFAVRYQSVGEDAEDSDKVFGGAIGDPNTPPAVPLPPAAWMGIITMGMVGYRQWKQRKMLLA